jgi:hypothetical protein
MKVQLLAAGGLCPETFSAIAFATKKNVNPCFQAVKTEYIFIIYLLLLFYYLL